MVFPRDNIGSSSRSGHRTAANFHQFPTHLAKAFTPRRSTADPRFAVNMEQLVNHSMASPLRVKVGSSKKTATEVSAAPNHPASVV